jgi:hypothetical protein
MKTKNLIIGGTLLMSVAGLCFWYNRKRGQLEKPISRKPETPEELFKEIVKNLLIENSWKNERDFLSKLSHEYIKEAPDYSWIVYLPICQSDLMNKLKSEGILSEFEKNLEKRYQRKHS